MWKEKVKVKTMRLKQGVFDFLRVWARIEDHQEGVGLNFTSEIIYLQPLDSSAAASPPLSWFTAPGLETEHALLCRQGPVYDW